MRRMAVLLLVVGLASCGSGDVSSGGLDAADIEQTAQGGRAPAALVASFDGLGVGFEGPHGPSTGRNPSDNSLAVGPDHIVQVAPANHGGIELLNGSRLLNVERGPLCHGDS